LACASALHKVCAQSAARIVLNHDATNSALDELSPPGPPVSMCGVVKRSWPKGIRVACCPKEHFSVPVEWYHMHKYDGRCKVITDHRDHSIGCQLAAHKFCNAARPSGPENTGVVFEADARAWVSCFAAGEVRHRRAATFPACSSLESDACLLAVTKSCEPDFDAGVIQATTSEELTIHCFNAPYGLGHAWFFW